MLPVALGGHREIGELLGVGAGGDLRAPLGIAVVGGMLFSTFFTLGIVPVAWVSVETLRERLSRRREASAATPQRSAPASS
jgi:hypothetical protein